uniref:Uncharacterized protein n=1 Tax=Myotis lucifugus TaxID=59463 RepID=G1QA06_MYOLU
RVRLLSDTIRLRQLMVSPMYFSPPEGKRWVRTAQDVLERRQIKLFYSQYRRKKKCKGKTRSPRKKEKTQIEDLDSSVSTDQSPSPGLCGSAPILQCGPHPLSQ